MIIIAAMSYDRVIGRGDGMPWDVPSEYKRFLDSIAEQTVIMGRRSYQIFGPSLTSQYNIVVSRSVKTYPRALVVPNVAEAIEVAESFDRIVFTAGGASIFEQTIGHAEAMYLSYIKGAYEGDAYFPEFAVKENGAAPRAPGQTLWRVERREEHPEFEFFEYRRETG